MQVSWCLRFCLKRNVFQLKCLGHTESGGAAQIDAIISFVSWTKLAKNVTYSYLALANWLMEILGKLRMFLTRYY